MNSLPVIEMEMRSASRRAWTFTLRLLFAFSGAGTCLVVLALPRLATREKGQTMLLILSYLSLGFCLTVGGFLTADCVSSEKREGTLGLLFLTPLKGIDIMLGKMVCHGLQMLYGLCAAFPVFFLPLLAGGVTWGEVGRVVLALALSLLLAQSVGILVSVLSMEARQAMMTTLATVVLMAALPMILWLLWKIFLIGPPRVTYVLPLSPVFTVFSAFESNYATARGHLAYWGSMIAIFVVSLVAVSLAAALVSRVFSKMGSSATGSGAAPTRIRTHVLEQNPYEWLMMRNLAQARSLDVLTGTCVTVFAVMLVASVATSHWQAGFSGAFFTAFAVHLIAKLRFAMETTRQVNADFAQRTLELLLVTTVTEESIIDGHHGALRRVAQRPLALLIGLNLILQLFVIMLAEPLHMDKEATVIFSSLFLGGILLARADFSTLRWLGLINGLKSATQVKATLRSYATAMLVPWVGMGLIISVIASLEPKASGLGLLICAWVGASWWYDRFLVRLAHDRLRVGLRRLASESC